MQGSLGDEPWSHEPRQGFRNALVHGYLRIDLALLHGVLNQHLDEVREFARCVDAHIGA